MITYLIANNSESTFYAYTETPDTAPFGADYPIETTDFSIMEIPSTADPALYLGARFLGPANSLFVVATGFNPETFLTYVELPPAGVATARWNGTNWRTLIGDAETGSLILEPSNVSDENIHAFAGSNVTIDCEYTCTDPTATVTYKWYNEGKLLLGTASSLTLSTVTDQYSGLYLCIPKADNGVDIGATGVLFSVKVYPAAP